MGLWTRKSIRELQDLSQKEHHALKKHLSAFDLILLGIGSILGAGLFSLTGIAAAENAGPAIALSFLLAALGCALAGVCYSELAAMIPISGSAYTYAYATMGEFVAWIIGWVLILEYALAAVTLAISWSAYLVSLLQDFNIHVSPTYVASPWQPITSAEGISSYGVLNLPAFLIIAVISLILILGIRQSAIFNKTMVVIKLSVVFLFMGLGFFYINYQNYKPFLPPNTGTFGAFGWSGVLQAAGVLFYAYIGFDALSTAAQETKNPQKAMPIGILGSLAICTVLYVLFALVLVGLVNYKELDVAAPVAFAIEHTPYPWLKTLVKIAILAGLTSGMLMALLGQSRIFYTMARDGLLPRYFGVLHPKFHTPWISNLILLVFVGLLSAFAPFSAVGHLTSLGTLLVFAMVCAGVLVLRYLEPDHPRPFRVPWAPFIPLLGVAVCTLMMFSLDFATWMRLIAWLILGILIYLFAKKEKIH